MGISKLVSDIKNTFSPIQKKQYQIKVILTAGFTLFAMFFGAGNIIFPLHIAANSGQHIFITSFGFLLTGVGVPFLGLVATSMFQGDYWAFFNRLGKVSALIIVTALMIIIGPLCAMPRIETIVFSTVSPYLPIIFQDNMFFSLVFCLLAFTLAYKENNVLDILGLILGPIKIISFSALIIVGILFSEPAVPSTLTRMTIFKQALVQGYSTMDLLATFFFSAVAFKVIDQSKDKLDKPDLSFMATSASILGALLIAIVYLGLMLVAYFHATLLQGIPEEHIVKAIALIVLGEFGGVFICTTIAFACLATTLALTEVITNYLHTTIFQQKISRLYCLVGVVTITYCMSNLGFQSIMLIMLPVLEVLYPTLIALSIMNILYKWKKIQTVKLPVYLTAACSLVANII